MKFNECEELNNFLKIFDKNISISCLHGLFCAFHSYPSPIDFEEWRLSYFSNQYSTLNTTLITQRAANLLKHFYDETGQNLLKNKFEPFLYHNLTTTAHYFQQISEWALGYFEGIKADFEWKKIMQKDEKVQEVFTELALFTNAEKLVQDKSTKDNLTIKEEVLKYLQEFNETFYNIGVASRPKNRYYIN